MNEFEKKNTTRKGTEGAAIIIEQMKEGYTCPCWRYFDRLGELSFPFEGCKQRPRVINLDDPNEIDTDGKPLGKDKVDAFHKMMDTDLKVHFSCKGCMVFDALKVSGGRVDGAEIDQWHEIKSNYATHGQSVRNDGKTDGARTTQNIPIETIENEGTIKDNKKKPLMGMLLEDDPRGIEPIYATEGMGWYNKTRRCKDDSRVLSDWYHFYQPIDPWDFENINVEAATDEEIEAWLNDNTVPDGSELIIQYPPSYCISIKGSYIEKMLVKEIPWNEDDYEDEFYYGMDIGEKPKKYFNFEDVWGNDERMKEVFGEIPKTKQEQRYKEKSIGWTRRGYLIPVADILPCYTYNRGADLERAEGTGELFNKDNIHVFIAADSIRKKPVKDDSASSTAERPHRYIIKRLIGAEETGALNIPVFIVGEDGIPHGYRLKADNAYTAPVKEKDVFHREEQAEEKKKWFTDEYSGYYLMPVVLERLSIQEAEGY